MLGRRDQWLPPVLSPSPRREIERSLKRVVEAHLLQLSGSFPDALGADLAALARYAAEQLGAEHAIGPCSSLRDMPAASLDGLPAWNGIAELLLTRAGEWRRRVDVRQGFPAGPGAAKEMKARMLQLLESLGDATELAGRLHALRALPDPEYSDADWSLLQALFCVLTTAVAHLKLVFRDQGKADFIETALAARDALGDDLEPTDLALRIDYGLTHLLVDEFQDTSQIQNDLLRRLTAGWQAGDGRTLFLVGDPMQSIYRFRKAEVILLVEKLGQLRSRAGIVGTDGNRKENQHNQGQPAHCLLLPHDNRRPVPAGKGFAKLKSGRFRLENPNRISSLFQRKIGLPYCSVSSLTSFHYFIFPAHRNQFCLN